MVTFINYSFLLETNPSDLDSSGLDIEVPFYLFKKQISSPQKCDLNHIYCCFFILNQYNNDVNHIYWRINMKQKIINTAREIAGIFLMFTAAAAVVLLQITTWI